MKVAIGCDHAAFELKEKVKSHLTEKGFEVVDYGTNGLESVDYPDFALKVAEAVRDQNQDWGILLCGTGIGVSITANKVKGVLAALCINTEMAELSRQHNNANILCLGARILDSDLALQIVDAWFSADFAGGRHIQRVKRIEEYEINL